MNANIKIEKDVLPPVSRGSKYPYELLEVNESFVVPNLSLQVVCNMNYRANLKFKRKFVARKVDDGVRVWRTA